jgi:hypothetical protein
MEIAMKKKISIKVALKFSIVCFIILGLATLAIAAEEKSSVFSTREGFEIDKCASIWLINRFIDPNARIIFYPKNSEMKEGILFDTPEAKFRRYFNMSTFESLLEHYKIKDPNLIYIGRIIHDIEINTWEKKALKETITIRDAVNKIIWETNETDILIRRSNRYFDSLYGGY